MNFAGARWFKSSKSGDRDCVEVAFEGAQVGVRDSKNIAVGHLTFPAHTWDAFTAGIARGDFHQA
ncbi:DUF397 domain-containing protein [Nocardia asteroides]|uniref:DUF397 domain-containing protein n=1 Tax=Nocardia asteroides TaxID=1824 RepID=UPI001E36F131|nr:DUF397 domain-containing protein [Nocardia asteroides]UGT64246.1 DUF397 domain-containing protein [Nocardia asteroides]